VRARHEIEEFILLFDAFSIDLYYECQRGKKGKGKV
jgi:hypothetical protein